MSNELGKIRNDELGLREVEGVAMVLFHE